MTIDPQETPLEIHGIPINIYVGFWRRLGALLLDFLIILIPIVIVLYINSLGRLYYFYTFIPNQLFILYYYVYLPKVQGGTPGKLLLDIKIIRIDGRDLDWQSAFLRYLPFFAMGFVSGVVMMFSLVSIDNDTYQELGWISRSRYLTSFYPTAHQAYLWATNAWFIISIIALLCDKRNRTLHDYIAGTVVVKGQYVNSLREVMQEETTAPHAGEDKPVDPSEHQHYFPGSGHEL